MGGAECRGQRPSGAEDARINVHAPYEAELVLVEL
jgi:hypothetical protein